MSGVPIDLIERKYKELYPSMSLNSPRKKIEYRFASEREREQLEKLTQEITKKCSAGIKSESNDETSENSGNKILEPINFYRFS